MNPLRFAALALLALGAAPQAAPSAPRRVIEINPNTLGSDPGPFVELGDVLLFAADDGLAGRELWRSDGSAAGTYLLSDILPGPAGSSPLYLTRVGSYVYFLASFRDLWRTDGTPAGTVLVKSFLPGMLPGGQPGSLTAVGAALFLFGDDGTGYALWKSDGTSTVSLKLFPPSGGIGGIGGNIPSPPESEAVGSTLYFAPFEATSGTELWKSDGTTAGTVLVEDILPGIGSSSPALLTAVGDRLYFVASDASGGRELWKSNGSAGNTTRVKDIRPGLESSALSGLTAVGSTLYFSADDGVHGAELWKSNGTPGGTRLVEDVVPGPAGSFPTSLTSVGSSLYFVADGGRLWKGSSNPVPVAGVPLFPTSLFAAGDTLYFAAAGGLWSSTGLLSEVAPSHFALLGTTLYFAGVDLRHGAELRSLAGLVVDINLAGLGSHPQQLTAAGPLLFFTADDGQYSYQLWRSDGSEAGTMPLGAWYVQHLTAAGARAYFMADDGTHGLELWTSDGTPAGTGMVVDLNPGPGAGFGYLQPMAAVGSTLYFNGFDGTAFALYKSNGTAAGTLKVKDVVPTRLTPAGSLLYFEAGGQLWKSNGNAGGTTALGGASPESLTAVGSTLYFSSLGAGLRELWKSNGTVAGTLKVKDVAPADLTRLGSQLLFTAEGTIWRSNGTSSGTFSLAAPGLFFSTPGLLTTAGGSVYFSGSDALGWELWKSNGTAAGTLRVKDIHPAGGSFPQGLEALGVALYFSADDGVNGRGLWTSNGSTAGTRRIGGPGAPEGLQAVGGTLFFTADDGLHGRELWAYTP